MIEARPIWPLAAINPGLAARAEKVEGSEDVGQRAAIDQQVKAEDYLLEHKPEGFKRSARAEAERKQLRLGIDRAYYRHDVTQHKKAVDALVLDTLKEYANWRGEHQGEAAGASG
jgi:hypothetical protein